LTGRLDKAHFFVSLVLYQQGISHWAMMCLIRR
jgi:hypothetical protein